MLLAGAVAVLVVVIKNPPPSPAEQTHPGGELVKPDVPMKFAGHQNEILGLAQQFVVAAVARKHVADSWEMVCPELRQGYTRTSWAKGDIPVVPFPAYVAKWHLSYSFQTEIDVQVALFARPEKKLNPVVFDLTFHPCGVPDGQHWLVSSFLPVPSASGDFGPSTKGGGGPFQIGAFSPFILPKRANAAWLLVPFGIVLGMLMIALGIVGIRGYRGKRAYDAYVRERQIARRSTV
jgi:hypothetical protein